MKSKLDGEAASCLQSLSKQLKRMEALYRNVRLPESVCGKGGGGLKVICASSS